MTTSPKIITSILLVLKMLYPQIKDFGVINPGDCLVIPGATAQTSFSTPTTTYTYTETYIPVITTAPNGVPSSSASPPADGNCGFTISSIGEIACPAGQLSNGQIRLNGSKSTSMFYIADGKSTDFRGRGCIVTGKTKFHAHRSARLRLTRKVQAHQQPKFSIISTAHLIRASRSTQITSSLRKEARTSRPVQLPTPSTTSTSIRTSGRPSAFPSHWRPARVGQAHLSAPLPARRPPL